MKRFIARRLMQGVVLLFMVATIVFFLGRLTGNPVDLMLPEDATAEDRAQLTQTLGLDGPLSEQFLIFIGKALHGDLGTSIRMKQPAVEAFFEIPLELRDRHREVYAILTTYFQQDPAAWDEGRGL